MRTLFVMAVACAVPAMAQAISGTASATLDGFDEYADPKVTVTVSLTCSLSCPPSRPELHYAVNGGVDAFFASLRSERAGVYFGAFFGSDDNGNNVTTDRDFKAGTATVVKAKSATCWCGNATGEGGYVDLESAVLVIPPTVVEGARLQQGDDGAVIVKALPRGGETVAVKLSGGGLDETRTLSESDFNSTGNTFVRFTPTQGGTLAVTATLLPHGASTTTSVAVAARGMPTGGGSGSSGTGGGGGSEEEPTGCASVGVLPLFALGGLLLRRRRR